MEKIRKDMISGKFNLMYKPRAPYKPKKSEIKTQFVQVEKAKYDEFDDINIPAKATHCRIESCGSDDAQYIEVIFGYYDTPSQEYLKQKEDEFEKSLINYNKQYAIYRKKLKEWNEAKKKYDKEHEAATVARELDMLKKLQNKYGTV